MEANELWILYGCDARDMARELLEQIQPAAGLRPDARIGIKPNLVVAQPAVTGATTTPGLVAGIIEHFQTRGFRNLVILEGSWVGDQTARAFRTCGYETLSRQYQVPLVDLQHDRASERRAGGMTLQICDQVLQLDYLINVPVLKGHCQTLLTCALKNMKGCIPNSEKRRYHALGLHDPIACLNAAIRPDLILVDALNGDLNFEEGGHPTPLNRIIAARDPVLCDTYAASLMGFSLEEIPYIGRAADLGVGSGDLSAAVIRELNSGLASASGLPAAAPSGARRHASLIDERQACSACYGSLIHALERLHEHGSLGRVRQKICIGQGFKGMSGHEIGIGSCTASLDSHLSGCPPKAADIVEFLEKRKTVDRDSSD